MKKANYSKTPRVISYKEIGESAASSLSASQYARFSIGNSNQKSLRTFLTRPLSPGDKGTDIGSDSYIRKSPFYFIRTKALQAHAFTPELDNNTLLSILPQSFIDQKLKKGDVLISKDSNIGECVILDKDYPHHMLSGGIYKLPLGKYKYYVLAFIKHPVFREQLQGMVPRGATIRHAKQMFLDCKIPEPTKDTQKTMQFVAMLTKALIEKESLIKDRHGRILSLIDSELRGSQKADSFVFEFPGINELNEVARLDTGLYTQTFKENQHTIKNYKNGCTTIFDLGFTMSRGQNLQVSNIGLGVYSDTYHKGFYNLILPTNISAYGTVAVVQYFGSSKNLKTLNKGELIFGAEATFRSFVVVDDAEKVITNIHGITLHNADVTKSIFLKCFLDYLVHSGTIDCIKVGGNGGSFAQKYWNILQIPLFPRSKMTEIAQLYHHPDLRYDMSSCTPDTFLQTDAEFNTQAGICELDKSAKLLKAKIHRAIDAIINDEPMDLGFGDL